MTAQQTSLAALRTPTVNEGLPIVAGFFDAQGFELLQRVAKAFASSELVPKQYQGNIANCMIAMDMANRMGVNPLMAIQNLYVVHGMPSWSSKFLVATINASGRFSTLRYEWKGQPKTDEYGCRAWAIERETGERLDGIWVTWKMASAEGWVNRNGSKWQTMPDQMFLYRAAAFWHRAYAPELGMGLLTVEEAHDIIDMNPDGSIASVTGESLRKKEGRDADLTESAVSTATETADRETGEIHSAPPNFAESEPLQPPEKWVPSAEERAEIHACEMAEANEQPVPQPRARRERSMTSSME